MVITSSCHEMYESRTENASLSLPLTGYALIINSWIISKRLPIVNLKEGKDNIKSA